MLVAGLKQGGEERANESGREGEWDRMHNLAIMQELSGRKWRERGERGGDGFLVLVPKVYQGRVALQP